MHVYTFWEISNPQSASLFIGNRWIYKYAYRTMGSLVFLPLSFNNFYWRRINVTRPLFIFTKHFRWNTNVFHVNLICLLQKTRCVQVFGGGMEWIGLNKYTYCVLGAGRYGWVSACECLMLCDIGLCVDTGQFPISHDSKATWWRKLLLTIAFQYIWWMGLNADI